MLWRQAASVHSQGGETCFISVTLHVQLSPVFVWHTGLYACQAVLCFNSCPAGCDMPLLHGLLTPDSTQAAEGCYYCSTLQSAKVQQSDSRDSSQSMTHACRYDFPELNSLQGRTSGLMQTCTFQGRTSILAQKMHTLRLHKHLDPEMRTSWSHKYPDAEMHTKHAWFC